MKIYERLDRQSLGRMDAEQAHALALKSLSNASKFPGGLAALRRLAPRDYDERLRVRLWGLPFPNPIGVAAGMDKNAVAVNGLLALGFGHVEIGTVTLQPQPGNAPPRLWRAPEQHAVVNALGFPSQGAAAVRNRLKATGAQGIVGVNIGKNRDIPVEEAPEAYASLVLALADVASYITVNVSSPNTEGLRALQMSNELEAILKAVQNANRQAATARRQISRPVLVKVAPDLSPGELEAIGQSAVAGGADGIIATNTTISREGVPERFRELPGGLSGQPLRERANQVVKILYKSVGDQLPIVGVGGIASAADVVERMASGASLVQLYTAFIYSGPALPGRILRDLSAHLDREGVDQITELTGTSA